MVFYAYRNASFIVAQSREKPAFSRFHGQVTVRAITPISDHVLVPIGSPSSSRDIEFHRRLDRLPAVALSPATLDRICNSEVMTRITL